MDWSFTSVPDGSFLSFVALAMWLMVGVEFICPMINEVNLPVRNISRVLSLSLLAMFPIFPAFVFGASQ